MNAYQTKLIEAAFVSVLSNLSAGELRSLVVDAYVADSGEMLAAA